MPLLTLHNPAQSRRYYQEGVWKDDTLFTLLERNARAHPDASAVRDSGVRLTWAQLLERVNEIALLLESNDLKQGDRVSIWLPSRVESVIILLACSRNGYVCNTSLHQNYTVQEVADLLRSIRTRVLLTEAGYGADRHKVDLLGAVEDLPDLKQVYLLGNSKEQDSRELLPGTCTSRPKKEVSSLSAPVRDPDKVCYLAFTSGTTDKPKGVLHSDNTLLANARQIAADWDHDRTTVLLTLSPLSHHIGTVAINQVLVTAGELVVNNLGKERDRHIVDWIEESGATYVMGVPTHAMDILQELRRRDRRKLGKVTTFYMAGAAIPVELAKQLLTIGAVPQNVYGMTENGSHQYTMPKDSVTTITASVGKACAGFEVRLWSESNPDLEVSEGDIGEIGSRGALLMLGYYDNQRGTEDSFNASGWFLSGDLGQFDSDGNLRIVGRKKDLIIRGGHNIFPARIEELSLTYPGVLRAAAFPVPDERLGERVCLAVSCDGDTMDARDLIQHLYDSGLSKFDMPEYFLSLPELPLTASGKILKRTLVEWYKSGEVIAERVHWKAPESSRP